MTLIVVPYLFPVRKPVLNKHFPKLENFCQTLLAIGLIAGMSSCSDASLVTSPPQNFGSSLNTTAAEQHPRFSYDGRYLVLASDRQAQRNILLYDLPNQRFIPLPGLNQPGIMHDLPDISADGRYIVYVSENSGRPDIFIYDRHTQQTEKISKDWLGEVRNPTISGNGRFVAFETNRTGQWDIVIYDRGANAELSLPQRN
ncbi:MAG: PD40 domain-containing protein [Hydrococcus sp. C42_A2020_068]|uniref:TolB family protein n=1 Tax=Pleurocapsa sp. PCC 7327 TaxID=118163 RepID=UPI000A07344F|nr:PD40 domain-containing protein [Pleurocapsa sp. PCC 7327]MBF2019169.1 PD40 domain-containing protein [Hydrococcus sp. C42_A2020_068]